MHSFSQLMSEKKRVNFVLTQGGYNNLQGFDHEEQDTGGSVVNMSSSWADVSESPSGWGDSGTNYVPPHLPTLLLLHLVMIVRDMVVEQGKAMLVEVGVVVEVGTISAAGTVLMACDQTGCGNWEYSCVLFSDY